jgi:hypothetical protein
LSDLRPHLLARADDAGPPRVSQTVTPPPPCARGRRGQPRVTNCYPHLLAPADNAPPLVSQLVTPGLTSSSRPRTTPHWGDNLSMQAAQPGSSPAPTTLRAGADSDGNPSHHLNPRGVLPPDRTLRSRRQHHQPFLEIHIHHPTIDILAGPLRFPLPHQDLPRSFGFTGGVDRPPFATGTRAGVEIRDHEERRKSPGRRSPLVILGRTEHQIRTPPPPRASTASPSERPRPLPAGGIRPVPPRSPKALLRRPSRHRRRRPRIPPPGRR